MRCARPRGTSGLSPRVRGNHRERRDEREHRGSIPAGAGEPTCWPSSLSTTEVYPRGCGGTSGAPGLESGGIGLSPRVRGNLSRIVRQMSERRSIPAGAGEPPAGRGSGIGHAVYPRGCGGTGGATTPGTWHVGLSPRVRGNRRARSRPGHSRGSIPAGAGEPQPDAVGRLQVGVYPRGCGGTPGRRTGASVSRVYPRGCGGTELQVPGGRNSVGLSPRVRGNRPGRDGRRREPGSIPAGAGEPRSGRDRRSPPRVYPRGCGGTRIEGELPEEDEVYPRGCGGTRLSRQHGGRRRGLSPRVRGNHDEIPFDSPALGSIPAGAGEPSGSSCRRWRTRVYPRGCGGTGVARTRVQPAQGLSPRVRGNRVA